jgi:hypothetical protein
MQIEKCFSYIRKYTDIIYFWDIWPYAIKIKIIFLKERFFAIVLVEGKMIRLILKKHHV